MGDFHQPEPERAAMNHYGAEAAASPYIPSPAPHPYPQPPPGLEIPPPPPHVQTTYHPYPSGHHPYPQQPGYPALPHHPQYPPGYAPPPPYASPPPTPHALYPDGRLATHQLVYPPTTLPPPSPYRSAPVVVYANPQPSPAPPLCPPQTQQGYYSSMLNSPLPSPHPIPSSPRQPPYALSLSSNQTSPATSVGPSPLPSPHQTNGLSSPLSVHTNRSPVSSMKSPGSFQSMKSPTKSPRQTSPVQAVKSPARSKSPAKADNASQGQNGSGPLRSLEKMLMHPENVNKEQVNKDVDCKLNILNEGAAREDSCRRRSSSHSMEDVKSEHLAGNCATTRDSHDQVDSNTSAPVDHNDGDDAPADKSDAGNKRRGRIGRPPGSKTKTKRTHDDHTDETDFTPKKRKRLSKKAAKAAEALLKEKTAAKQHLKHDLKRGPRIRIEGTRSAPNTCTVINNITNADDKDKNKSRPHDNKTDVNVNRVDNVKLTDAPWVCCFCGWGSTHTQLGDLFGPYQIEGFRPPKRDSPTKKSSRRRRDSHCSADEDRQPSRRPSGEHTQAGEAWIHEECVTWAEGVYMVGYKMQGLDEAARIARQTQCTACKVYGATIGCLHKGCQQKYHYPCALSKDCLLNEENFSLVCHKHKDKKVKMINR